MGSRFRNGSVVLGTAIEKVPDMSFLPGHMRAAFAQARANDDWYVETPPCVHSLFDAVQFEGVIHDPCCGGGTIPKVARERGYIADGSDLRNRGFGVGDVDFFQDHSPRENIISNPPYKLGEEFVHHALSIARRRVAIVMRISFLAGQKRRKTLFDIHPPALVLILSTRPSMPPGGTDIPAKGGTVDYCWLVWSQSYFGETIMKWA